MSRLKKMVCLLLVSIILMAGCSGKETSDESKNDNQEKNNVQEDEVGNSDGGQKEDSEEGDNEQDSDIPTGHQDGLTMEESGYVEDADDQYKVTINSIDKDVDIGIDPSIIDSETFAVANITVENIDDHKFNAKNIFKPSFANSNDYYMKTNNSDFFDIDEVNLDLLEGEIKPGESVTGEVAFAVDGESKDGKYYFEIGTKQDQIIQAARWELDESDLD